MNYIDMFILVLLIYAVFRGMVRGLVLQLASLAALIAGIFAALKLSGFTARFLADHWTLNYEYLYILSIGITFTLVFIMINLVGKGIDNLIETVHLSFMNKLAGAFFNVCKVMLIVGILLLFVDRIDKQIAILPEKAREGSFFYKPVTAFTRFLFPSLVVEDPADEERHHEFV